MCDEVLAWQQRPLDALYPVIYLDAIIVVKVRDGGHVRNKAAHIAVGVDTDGIKHVLGIWVQTSEGAKFLSAAIEIAPQAAVVFTHGRPASLPRVWPRSSPRTATISGHVRLPWQPHLPAH